MDFIRDWWVQWPQWPRDAFIIGGAAALSAPPMWVWSWPYWAVILASLLGSTLGQIAFLALRDHAGAGDEEPT